ncbi:hypothetical protein SAMN05519105_1994 [Rhodobacter sp. 24-YEA-8]|nr:hypothetical protein SAMN05519105_1994 [Rhodobacter sp. 24-YEA-8]
MPPPKVQVQSISKTRSQPPDWLGRTPGQGGEQDVAFGITSNLFMCQSPKATTTKRRARRRVISAIFLVAGPVTLSCAVARDSLRPLYLHCIRLCDRGAAALHFICAIFLQRTGLADETQYETHGIILVAARPGNACKAGFGTASALIRLPQGRQGILHIVVPTQSRTTASGIPDPCHQSAQLLAIM